MGPPESGGTHENRTSPGPSLPGSCAGFFATRLNVQAGCLPKSGRRIPKGDRQCDRAELLPTRKQGRRRESPPVSLANTACLSKDCAGHGSLRLGYPPPVKRRLPRLLNRIRQAPHRGANIALEL